MRRPFIQLWEAKKELDIAIRDKQPSKLMKSLDLPLGIWLMHWENEKKKDQTGSGGGGGDTKQQCVSHII